MLKKQKIISNGKIMHYSVGIIVKCNGKYLLMDRINPPPGFASPAGHIDENEDPYNAALRELQEETSITAEKLEFLIEEEIPWNYCKNADVHYWYLYIITVSNEINVMLTNEAKSMKWYTLEEMKNLPLEEVWEYWFKKLGILK